jgi:hypothetical protein
MQQAMAIEGEAMKLYSSGHGASDKTNMNSQRSSVSIASSIEHSGERKRERGSAWSSWA